MKPIACAVVGAILSLFLLSAQTQVATPTAVAPFSATESDHLRALASGPVFAGPAISSGAGTINLQGNFRDTPIGRTNTAWTFVNVGSAPASIIINNQLSKATALGPGDTQVVWVQWSQNMSISLRGSQPYRVMWCARAFSGNYPGQ